MKTLHTEEKQTWLSQHPIITGVIGSLIASAILAILTFFTDIPQEVYLVLTDSENDTLAFLFSSDVFTIKTKLWILGLFIIFLIFIVILISFNFGHKHAKKSLIHISTDTACNSCSKIVEFSEKAADLQSKIQEQDDWNDLITKLDNYTQNSEVVDSIQLFTYTPLPDYKNIDSKKYVDISFRFKGGCTKPNANVNALYNMNYQFSYDIYESLIKLFKKRNEYYATSAYGKPADKETERIIQDQAISVFNEITELLNNIQDEQHIEDIHYVYYRMLEVLTNVVLSPAKAIDCKKLLKINEGIENKLKTGMRTGMLGTLFIEATYSFCNENSFVKSNRSYFSTPLNYKEQKLILLVILERDKLRLGPNGRDDIKCCESIYYEIANILKRKSA